MSRNGARTNNTQLQWRANSKEKRDAEEVQ